MARTTQKAKVGGRELTFSNLDKVLWPRDGYTKGDLIAYYLSVAKWLLPHVKDRPLTLQRYPDGIGGQSFFEKQAPKFTPGWIKTFDVSAEQGSRKIAYILCNDEATLAWCANLASIVLHVWYSHRPTLEYPDYALFDLDPGEGCPMKRLAKVALEFHDMLADIGLRPLVKTTGGSGLHLVIPVKAKYSYDALKQFGEIAARRVARELPKLTTLERSIARRPKGTVLLDWVQIGRGKTVVPPFGVRARDEAPVSMTLDWSEVEEFASKRGSPEAANARWTIANARERLQIEGDLWAGKHWKPAALETALKKAQRAWT
jgi:bifunctional non-homologous end joining protein LigD